MSNVVAMPTTYKGYRFRSRLEARWAMFFDRTGVEWVHEPQPVLVNDEPYLPDFELKFPDGTTAVHEVKALHERDRIKPPKVYLAGKMSPAYNWRGFSPDCAVGARWTERYIRFGGFLAILTGPYVAEAGNHVDDESWEHNPHISDVGSDWLLERCLNAIDACDIFCAHISTADAWGTISEIGYAKARGKKISITFEGSVIDSIPWHRKACHGLGQHDMWFPQMMADETTTVRTSADARAFHAHWIGWNTSREYRLISGIGLNSSAVMTFGDPLNVATTSMSDCHEWKVDLVLWCRDHKAEAEAVRAHRFDRQ